MCKKKPYDTSYMVEPPMSVEEWLKHSKYGVDIDRKELETFS